MVVVWSWYGRRRGVVTNIMVLWLWSWCSDQHHGGVVVIWSWWWCGDQHHGGVVVVWCGRGMVVVWCGCGRGRGRGVVTNIMVVRSFSAATATARCVLSSCWRLAFAVLMAPISNVLTTMSTAHGKLMMNMTRNQSVTMVDDVMT